jgi:hypothetical protein
MLSLATHLHPRMTNNNQDNLLRATRVVCNRLKLSVKKRSRHLRNSLTANFKNKSKSRLNTPLQCLMIIILAKGDTTKQLHRRKRYPVTNNTPSLKLTKWYLRLQPSNVFAYIVQKSLDNLSYPKTLLDTYTKCIHKDTNN